jgi:hypothetical protein
MLVLLAGCGADAENTAAGTASPVSAGPAEPVVGDGATPAPSPDAEGEADDTTMSVGDPVDADHAAGVLSSVVPEAGTGELTVVPGSSQPPGSGRRIDVAVSVEGGLDVDPARFAEFVMSTLNDPRGWTHDDWTFARTDDEAAADVIVVLASPSTSAAMCRPLVTGGRLSCREGRRTILTWYRWVNGTQDYGEDRTAYRTYVVNHEVGHFLGHGHQQCPGRGELAPVMMQQTKGLKGCLPNPWPYP